MCCYAIKEELEELDMFELTDIMDRTYISVTTADFAQQTHLGKKEQVNLKKVL